MFRRENEEQKEKKSHNWKLSILFLLLVIGIGIIAYWGKEKNVQGNITRNSKTEEMTEESSELYSEESDIAQQSDTAESDEDETTEPDQEDFEDVGYPFIVKNDILYYNINCSGKQVVYPVLEFDKLQKNRETSGMYYNEYGEGTPIVWANGELKAFMLEDTKRVSAEEYCYVVDKITIKEIPIQRISVCLYDAYIFAELAEDKSISNQYLRMEFSENGEQVSIIFQAVITENEEIPPGYKEKIKEFIDKKTYSTYERLASEVAKIVAEEQTE